MSKLRRLSGDEVITILGRFGFTSIRNVAAMQSCDAILRIAGKQTLTVPRHRELDTGTLLALYRQAARFISAEELYPHFYSD